LGLVASLNRPGANVTGFAVLLVELAQKQLQLLREAIPQQTVEAIIDACDVRGPIKLEVR
jgi:xanthine permease XanP